MKINAISSDGLSSSYVSMKAVGASPLSESTYFCRALTAKGTWTQWGESAQSNEEDNRNYAHRFSSGKQITRVYCIVNVK